MKKLDITMTEARSASEAINFLVIGVKWFLIHHTKKTIIALLILFGSALFVVFDYVQKSSRPQRNNIEKVIPK
jgi:hypothetical protein